MIRVNKLDHEHVINSLPMLSQVFTEYKDKIDAVYLFESFHKGNVKPLSDIDIAILFKKNVSSKVMQDIESNIYGKMSNILRTDEIDLINLNLAPLSIQYGVLKDKEYIFLGNKGNIIDFENSVILEYLDFQPYREEMNRMFLNGISEVRA